MKINYLEKVESERGLKKQEKLKWSREYFRMQQLVNTREVCGIRWTVKEGSRKGSECWNEEVMRVLNRKKECFLGSKGAENERDLE